MRNLLIGFVLGALICAAVLVPLKIERGKAPSKPSISQELVATLESQFIPGEEEGPSGEKPPKKKGEEIPEIIKELFGEEIIGKGKASVILAEFFSLLMPGKEEELAKKIQELDEESISQLVQLLRDEKASKYARLSAAQILGKINEQRPDPTLSNLLEDEALPFIGKILSSEEEKRGIQYSAIRALEEIRGEGSLKLLLKVAEGEDSFLSRQAIKAMVKTKSERANELLLGLLKKGKEDYVRIATANALAEHGDRAMAQNLMDILEGYPSSLTTILAAGALGAINKREKSFSVTNLLQQRCVPRLKEILRGEGDQYLKKQAIKALAEIGGEEANDYLLKIFKGEEKLSSISSYQAASALGRSGGRELISPLSEIIRERKTQSLTISAIETLGKINDRIDDPEARAILKSEGIPVIKEVILSDVKSYRKSQAVRILGKIGDKDDIPFLEEVLKSNPELRGAVNSAKRRIRSKARRREWGKMRYPLFFSF